MNKKYIVTLEAQEREDLERLVRTGKAAAYKIRHANILLAADTHGPNWTDAQLAEGFSLSERGVAELRQRFVEQGLAVALGRKKRENPSVAAMFDGEKEAQLVALACSEAPSGRGRWSLRLLAEKAVELQIVDQTSHETVRRVLKKTRSSPG